jgi:hypothetical protein
MARQRIVSREYKVMLLSSLFRGDEKRLLESADRLWRDFSKSVADIVIQTKGDLRRIKSRRVIKFFDTGRRRLNEGGYIFRERRDLERGDRQVTLKFRHRDRNVTQDRDMDAQDQKRAESKFEEDIKAPFISLYSFSTTVGLGDKKPLKQMRDVVRLFPKIAEKLDGFSDNETIGVVNDFTARELVLCGGNVRIGKNPKTDAECALIVWYHEGGRRDTPCAVEFSYRYGDEREAYDGAAARRAGDVFDMLNRNFTAWVDSKSRTKTNVAYGD